LEQDPEFPKSESHSDNNRKGFEILFRMVSDQTSTTTPLLQVRTNEELERLLLLFRVLYTLCGKSMYLVRCDFDRDLLLGEVESDHDRGRFRLRLA